MNLFPNIEKAYSRDHLNARDAQRLAQFIAFGPIVFQTSRLMLKFGILDRLRDGEMTLPEIARSAGISDYAAKVLVEASLSIGTVLVDPETDRYSLSKVGWFLLNDPATRVNVDFNHDVNYEGFFRLEEALLEGRPAGLEHFGGWPTIYEGLSSLPEQVQKSWFAFDHFYSDHSFEEALRVVFGYRPGRIMDVGGNTGRWALRCVAYDPDVQVTVVDLPQQLEMMRRETAGHPGAERISGCAMNMLDPAQQFPANLHPDIVWMSQFLDCFSEEEILGRIRAAVNKDGLTVYAGKPTDSPKRLPISFMAALTASQYGVETPRKQLITPDSLAEGILAAVLSRNEEAMDRACARIRDYLSEDEVYSVLTKHRFYELMSSILHKAEEQNVSLPKAEINALVLLPDPALIVQDLKRILLSVDLSGKARETADETAALIVEYIIANAYDPDLNLQDMSDRFNLSADYISTMVKKETGSAFKEYVTLLRISEARRLLMEDKSLTVRDAALRVGYRKASNFSKKFKELTGMLPSEIR